MKAFDTAHLLDRPIEVGTSEFVTRQERVREAAERCGCDVFVGMDAATIRYLTGYPLMPSERPFAIILDQFGASTLFVPLLKEHDVSLRAKTGRVVSYRDYPGRTHPIKALALLIESLKPKRALLEMDEHQVPYGYRGPSLSANLDTAVKIDRELVQRLRMVKSSDEIALLRHASDWSVFAQHCLQDIVQSDTSESRISIEASTVALTKMRELYGDRDRRISVSAGFGGQVGAEGTAHHYQRAVDPVFRSGDLMITRVYAQIGGYYSDIERTLVCGRASQKTSTLFEQGVEIQAFALSLVRPGVAVAEIDQAVFDRFVSLRIDDCWRHHTGHSVGLLEREAPYVDIGSETILEPGMLITVEPGVYRSGVGGFRHSDCVLVTENGCEILTEWPRDLMSLTVDCLP